MFVESGYRRAQMDDVAERLGVSKGTLYRSVDSKGALLAAVLIYGDRPDGLDAGRVIEVAPLPEVAERLAGDLTSSVAALELTRVTVGDVLVAPTRVDVAKQIERMALELFDTMSGRRVLIKVLDRCATEVPELSGWFDVGRYTVVDLWETYLQRIAEHVDGEADRAMLARTIVELVALWAVKMPWDPAPRPYPADVGARCAGMVVDLVAGGRT